MPSWEELGFNIVNIVLGEKKTEVEMACANETILLPFPSSEVKKGTESCGAVPGTVNCKHRVELWMRCPGGPGPSPGQLRSVVIGRSPLQIIAPGELRNGVA